MGVPVKYLKDRNLEPLPDREISSWAFEFYCCILLNVQTLKDGNLEDRNLEPLEKFQVGSQFFCVSSLLYPAWQKDSF